MVERKAGRSTCEAFGAIRANDITAISTAPMVHIASAGPRKKCLALGIAATMNDAATSTFPIACRTCGEMGAAVTPCLAGWSAKPIAVPWTADQAVL
jgi:hypothetical protein